MPDRDTCVQRQLSSNSTAYSRAFRRGAYFCTCIFNALLKTAGNQAQVLHDLGVALLAKPQELQPPMLTSVHKLCYLLAWHLYSTRIFEV